MPKSTLLKFSWNLFIRFFWYWQYSNRIEAFLREFLEKLFLCPKWGKLGILGNKINTFWLQVLGETVHCYFVLVLSWSTSLLLLLAMVSFAFSFLLSLALLLGLVACCPLHLFGKKVIISPDFFVVFYFFPPNWGTQFLAIFLLINLIKSFVVDLWFFLIITLSSSVMRKFSQFFLMRCKCSYAVTFIKVLSINPIQDGLFRGCSRIGGAFWPPSLKSTTHILQ